MSWYNGGDWDNLSLQEMMVCVRELMWAINEREHALGKREADEFGYSASRYLAGLSSPYNSTVQETESEDYTYAPPWLAGAGSNKVLLQGYTKWLCYADGGPSGYSAEERVYENLVEKAFPELSDFQNVSFPLFFQENLRRLGNSIMFVYKLTEGYNSTWMSMLTCAHKLEGEDGTVIYNVLTDKDETIWDTVLSGGLGFDSFRNSWHDRRELLDKASGATPYDVKWNWCEYQGQIDWPWVAELNTTDFSPFIEIKNVLDKMKYIQTTIQMPLMAEKCYGKIAALPLEEVSGVGILTPDGEDCADDYGDLKTTFEALSLVPVYYRHAPNLNMFNSLAPSGTVGAIGSTETTIIVDVDDVSGKDDFPEVTPFYIYVGEVYRYFNMACGPYTMYWYVSETEIQIWCSSMYAGMEIKEGDTLTFNSGQTATISQDITIPEANEAWPSKCTFVIKFELDSGCDFPTEDEAWQGMVISAPDMSHTDRELMKVVEFTSGGDWVVERSDDCEFTGTSNVYYINPVPYYEGNVCYANRIEVESDTVVNNKAYPERYFVDGYQNSVRMAISQFFSQTYEFDIQDITKVGGQLKYIKADYRAECKRPHTATLELSASGEWDSFAVNEYFEMSESVDEEIPYIGCINDDSVMNCSLSLDAESLDMPANADMTTREVQPFLYIYKEDYGPDFADGDFLKNSQAEEAGYYWEIKTSYASGSLTKDTTSEISGTTSWKIIAFPAYYHVIVGQTSDQKFSLEPNTWYRVRIQHKGDAFDLGMTDYNRSTWSSYYGGTLLSCEASVSETITEDLIYTGDSVTSVEQIIFVRVAPQPYVGATVWVDGIQFFKVHGKDFVREHSDDVSGVDNSVLTGGITLPFSEYVADDLGYSDPSEEVYRTEENEILFVGTYLAFERGDLDAIGAESGKVSISGIFSLPSDATIGSISGNFLTIPVNDPTSGETGYDAENYGEITTVWPSYNGIYEGNLGNTSRKGDYYDGDAFEQEEWIHSNSEWYLYLGDSELGYTQNKAHIEFWYKPELVTGEDETQTAYIASFLGSFVVGRQVLLSYDLDDILTYG